MNIFVRDHLGNHTYKSDVGGYKYGEDGSGAGRTLTYTAFNKPDTLTVNGATTMFT